MEHQAFWLADDDDMELALGGLNVSLRDYAKLGWLYLNQGTWTDNQNNIQQIVPQQWIIDPITARCARSCSWRKQSSVNVFFWLWISMVAAT
jgi:CubicO group peptidase (beta-lactamase class C family)